MKKLRTPQSAFRILFPLSSFPDAARYPGEPEYERLIIAFGFTDPTFFPKLFRLDSEGAWHPVL